MIHYKTGDATRPDEHNAVLVHCCNNIGRWGSGFVLAIDRAFGPEIGEAYRKNREWPYLGKMYPHRVGPKFNVWYVVNLIGQAGIQSPYNRNPIQYSAIREGLGRMDEWMGIMHLDVPVVMPRMGAGLAGGSWRKVEAVVQQALPQRDVYVYDLPGAVEGKDWNP